MVTPGGAEDQEKKSNIGSMEEQALKRKERLLLLRQKANNDDKPRKGPIFRNYVPENLESLPNTIVDPAEPESIEKEVQSQLEEMRTPIIVEDIDIVNLAPKKPDWDLKRDVSKKLDKLERRTQKAIAELILERLKGQEDILQAVNVGVSQMQSKLAAQDE